MAWLAAEQGAADDYRRQKQAPIGRILQSRLSGDARRHFYDDALKPITGGARSTPPAFEFQAYCSHARLRYIPRQHAGTAILTISAT